MACNTKALAAAIGDLEAFDAVAPSVSALLMVDAYRETVDWEDGDDESVAQTEIEKTIADNKEKLAEADIQAAQAGLEKAQTALKEHAEDAEKLQAATDELTSASHKVAETLYKDQGAKGEDHGSNNDGSAEGPIDAEVDQK